MLEPDIINEFRRLGAIADGHFILSSGMHSAVYIAKRAVHSDVMLISHLCGLLADQFRRSCHTVEVVVGPESGGDILSYCTAIHLPGADGSRPLSLVAEKDDSGGFTFPDQLGKKITGKNVVVVDNIVTAGGLLKKVIGSVRGWGGNVVGVGALWNRGDVTKETFPGIERFFALVSKKFETWSKDVCPICTANRMPIDTAFGHGADATEKLTWNFSDGRLP